MNQTYSEDPGLHQDFAAREPSRAARAPQSGGQLSQGRTPQQKTNSVQIVERPKSMTKVKASQLPGKRPKSARRALRDVITMKRPPTTREVFFAVIWLYLASTTFMYGMNSVFRLFVPIFAWAEPAGQRFMAVAAGGILAALVADGGWPVWRGIRMNAGETRSIGQYYMAFTMEVATFILSVLLTVSITMSYLDIGGVSQVAVQFLELWSFRFFLLIMALQGIGVYLFLHFDPDSSERASETRNAAKATSARIRFNDQVWDKAIKEVEKEALGDVQEFANLLKAGTKLGLVDDMLAQIPDPDARAKMRDHYNSVVLSEAKGGKPKKQPKPAAKATPKSGSGNRKN